MSSTPVTPPTGMRASGGAAAVVVTYSVGGLSLLNAIAGAYAEDLPVIAISGGPNTNSTAEYELLHHTMGKVDYGYQKEIFARVTEKAVIIQHAREAPTQIDHAIDRALSTRKPVYLEIACNVANAWVSPPNPKTFTDCPPCDPPSLDAAVTHAAELLNAAVKPVFLAGAKLRSAHAIKAFGKLIDACGYAVASMPNAKGYLDEAHTQYMGINWGPVGSPGCGEIVESADLCLAAGPVFTDYTTTGHTALVNPAKMINVQPTSVIMPGQTYNNVSMAAFLSALAPKLKKNDASLTAHRARLPR